MRKVFARLGRGGPNKVKRIEIENNNNSKFEDLKNSDPYQLLIWLREDALTALRAFSLDDDEKSDAFTDSLAKFKTALETAKSFGEIRSFVIRGVKWNAKDILRKKTRRSRREVPIESMPVDPAQNEFGKVGWETAASELSPNDDAATCVQRMAQSLNPAEKELFDLLYEKELTLQEVAAHYGVDIGVIYTRKHRLYSRLKRLANRSATGDARNGNRRVSGLTTCV